MLRALRLASLGHAVSEMFQEMSVAHVGRSLLGWCLVLLVARKREHRDLARGTFVVDQYPLNDRARYDRTNVVQRSVFTEAPRLWHAAWLRGHRMVRSLQRKRQMGLV